MIITFQSTVNLDQYKCSQNFTQNNINTQQNIDKNKNFFEKTGDWLSDFGSNIFQKPKAFDDGYDFGDVTITILGSAADAGLNAYNAVASMMEGIPKLAGAGIAQVADWAGNDEFADSMREQISDPNNDAFLSPKVNEFREKYIEPYSVLGSSSDKVASGIGSTIGASALSVIPGVGNVSLGKMFQSTVNLDQYKCLNGSNPPLDKFQSTVNLDQYKCKN